MTTNQLNLYKSRLKDIERNKESDLLSKHAMRTWETAASKAVMKGIGSIGGAL